MTFGQNIGYSVKGAGGCSLGYWPPNPDCPDDMMLTVNFPLSPAQEISSAGCNVGEGAVGYFLNGAGIFNSGDGQSYLNAGEWHSTAMNFEVYDLDICLGHAAKGLYHHHSWSPCLAEVLGDDGSKHSPIYGFILDGFPIYGPYQSKDLLGIYVCVAYNP